MENEKMENKLFEINDCKVANTDGKYYISGYANTKNKADSYGDIPTNYKGKKVYDITRMKTNPVMLVDHQISATRVMGNFVELEEDEKGLRFKVLLRDPEKIAQPDLKDVINGYIDGFIRALSIGGRWLYEDKANPAHLTNAIIHEISGVGVGADERSLTTASKPKQVGQANNSKATRLDELKALIADYREEPTDEKLKRIEEIKNEN